MFVSDSTRKRHNKAFYQDLRFLVFVEDASKEEYNIVDGGFVPWTRMPLNNNKEFFLISAMGTEGFIACFKKQP